jgi:septum formation protein
MDQTAPSLILASSSPRRRDLLSALGLAFMVVASGADEALFESLTPEEMVVELAVRKAKAVARSAANSLVLGADTTVVLDGEWLGKPADGEEAIKMLRRLSGRMHDVFTGVAIVDPLSVAVSTRVIRSRVAIRALSRPEIAAYVATGEPLDKAGAYGIQGFGRSLVASVDGCFNNVVGLPICAVGNLLAIQNPGFSTVRLRCHLEDGTLCPESAEMERARWG